MTAGGVRIIEKTRFASVKSRWGISSHHVIIGYVTMRRILRKVILQHVKEYEMRGGSVAMHFSSCRSHSPLTLSVVKNGSV